MSTRIAADTADRMAQVWRENEDLTMACVARRFGVSARQARHAIKARCPGAEERGRRLGASKRGGG